MMRHLGNTFAKSCSKGMLRRHRDFSSSSEKVVTAGTKVVEYCFKGAFFGGGYVFGGLISSPVSQKVVEAEEFFKERLEDLDEREANLEKMMNDTYISQKRKSLTEQEKGTKNFSL